MKNKSTLFLFLSTICGMLFVLQSCQDTDELSKEIDILKDRATALESASQSMNISLESLQALLQADMIVGVNATGDNYRIELDDGSTIQVVQASKVNVSVPQLSINTDGYWVYSTDKGATFNLLKDKQGNSIPATVQSAGKESVTPQLKVDATGGYWLVSYDKGVTWEKPGGEEMPAVGTSGTSESTIFKAVVYDHDKQTLTVTLSDNQKVALRCIESFYLRVLGATQQQTFPLGEKRMYEVEQNEVDKATILAPEGWVVNLDEKQITITSPLTNTVEKEDKIKIICTSLQGYLRVTTIPVKLLTTGFDANATAAWNHFVANNANNVLPDFSYAGYMHGEVAPPEIDLKSSGYTVYNVKDYGAKGDGATSDRQALLDIVKKIGRPADAKAIIYFPAGTYILHTDGEDKVDGVSVPIEMSFGGFVIKGDGRDKTFLKMAVPNVSPSAAITPPAMINIKHTVAEGKTTAASLKAGSAIASKGTFSIEVENATPFSPGQWVCLRLIDNNSTLIQKELTSKTADGNAWTKTADSRWTDIIGKGVQIYDYHQIAKKEGNKITFVEPLMHEVDPQWAWQLCDFPRYENVGVEDLTFVGNTQPGYLHHGNNYAADNDYKPIGMMRLVNSWMRRVNFTSITEALSISNSANISVYNIKIDGNRGHSAVRSGGASRVFIGKVSDHSKGNLTLSETQIGAWVEDAGQLHSCGISKQSMGTVIWNASWGQDACFEAHATQPRATLFDRCSGAFIKLHQGGAQEQLPNHLDDLVLWNFNAVNTNIATGNSFTWWDGSWTCFMPPTIVGFHGVPMTFSNREVKLNESPGAAVEPYSLYEAQLRKRLGYVPAWINSLK